MKLIGDLLDHKLYIDGIGYHTGIDGTPAIEADLRLLRIARTQMLTFFIRYVLRGDFQ